MMLDHFEKLQYSTAHLVSRPPQVSRIDIAKPPIRQVLLIAVYSLRG